MEGQRLIFVAVQYLFFNYKLILFCLSGKKARRRVEIWTSLILTVEGKPEPAHIKLFTTTRAQDFYWHTFTGTKQLDYTNWGKKPDKVNEGLLAMPSCVAMIGKDNLQWEARQCVEKKYFVCEFHLRPAKKNRSNDRQQKQENSKTACENG